MRHVRCWSGVVVMVVSLSACTQYGHYRTQTLAVSPPPAGSPAPPGAPRLTYKVEACAVGTSVASRPACDDPARVEAAGPAIQHRHYRYKPRTGDLRDGDYHLAFVEFDDQGWFADRKQMEALFLLLRDLEARPGTGGEVLLVVYAHGWKHNASACDNNVVCFSRLLERLDMSERTLQRAGRRAVLGVYVGWRGLSLDAGPLANLTFWTRKSTAERVGRGGVTELLTRLNDYRGARNPEREPHRTQLVITGHSFGGLIVYSALAHALMERAARTERPDRSGPARYAVARSVGDLVVLVNPAFEGSQYEPLFHIATSRCYPEGQRPVTLIVTSEADRATGSAFPLGRRVSTLLEHARSAEQGESILKTIGHDSRYQTHSLRTRPEVRAAPLERDRGPCGCPYLEPTESFDFRAYLKDLLDADDQDRADPTGRLEPRRVDPSYGSQVELIADPKYAANYPYLVVKTDAGVIADHNAIYNERFIEFLHRFFLRHIAQKRHFPAACWRDVEACDPAGLIPCEQSCRLEDGGSCCGRVVTDLR